MNPWLQHVKSVWAKTKKQGKSYRETLIIAKKTYKKKGAAVKKRQKKKSVSFERGAEEEETGGAIRKPRKRSPKRNEKIEQALATEKGGAIRKARKRSPKKDLKIEQALATKVGGGIRFHDQQHKYMYNKLTGRGASKDSPQCRTMMHSIMKNYHPSFWNSYVAGRVKDVPRFENDHVTPRRPQTQKKDSRADVIDTGGSLNPLMFSENGYLMSHNDEFHTHIEVV